MKIGAPEQERKRARAIHAAFLARERHKSMHRIARATLAILFFVVTFIWMLAVFDTTDEPDAAQSGPPSTEPPRPR